MGETFSRRRIVLVLIGVMLGMLLAALDQTIVGTALPRIVANLGGLEHYAWVATAYLLASTVSIPLYGKLSDIYGRRIFFIGGMVIFLAGSALAGTSQDMTQLIIYRAIQGLGAGAMMPIALGGFSTRRYTSLSVTGGKTFTPRTSGTSPGRKVGPAKM